ncbi:MAG: hypothetical protein ACRC4L_03385 [Mycoplasma sp.]
MVNSLDYAKVGFKFKHHDALEGSGTTTNLLIAIYQFVGARSIQKLISKCNIICGRLFANGYIACKCK